MPKRRKRKKEEHGVDESWLLPYADLLTLLLAVFIVLFASSSVDEANSDRFRPSSVKFSMVDMASWIMRLLQLSRYQKIQLAYKMKTHRIWKTIAHLVKSQERVDEYIAVNELENQFETKLTDEGLLITIRDSILFSKGSAEIAPEYAELAGDIADLLRFDPPRQVVVTGHTDNIPIHNAQFASNWELSVKRAVNFLTSIVNNEGIDPLLFSAKGYGEFHPIASNDTAEGRSKNRRVEVLVQPLVLEDGKAFQ